MTGHADQDSQAAQAGQPAHTGQPSQAGKAAKRQGVVVWFNERKGYGFIRDDEGQDVFVSWPDILRPGFKTLHEGERVRFCLKTGEVSPKAAEVVPQAKRI